MCGISGWSLIPGRTRERSQLYAMSKILTHRGPDDQGFFFDEIHGIALAHNRLSIIDLSEAGHQPMISEDGTTVLIFNGEIYNFQELRKELEGLGHRFRSRCDTEVILRGFMEWGSACVNRFCGMFAFVIWSVRENKLLMARDPLGMKPLYYAALPGGQGTVFASEIKAFLALPDFKAEMNLSALRQFLEFGYTYDTHETSLKGIFKLPPGHMLEIIQGYPGEPKAFFRPPKPDSHDRRSLPDREKELYTVLTEVVSQHLVADVPVGLLLSGGLDSSVTAALASRCNKVSAARPITTISMGFADSQVDERPYARLVSKFIHSEHYEVTIYPREITDGLEDLIGVFDDLFADWGLISTLLLYQKCREQGIKVVLVGEGSDEIFGGYPHFEAFTSKSSQGPKLWKLFRLYQSYVGRRYGREFPKFYALMRNYLQQSNGDLFQATRLFEASNQLPNNYVMKVDKASMAVSVEARTPYLDRRVAELAYRTPSDCLLAEGTTKFLLRSMAERYQLLPKEITRRSKYGASMAASWMDESVEFREYARKIILDTNGWVEELGLRTAMTDYFDGKQQGYSFPRAISVFRNLAWRLLLLNLWSRRYLK